MHEPFKPTPAFALELEQKGYPRAAIVMTLPPSAIPPEWRMTRGGLGMMPDEEERPAEVEAKIAAARDALSALNGGES